MFEEVTFTGQHSIASISSEEILDIVVHGRSLQYKNFNFLMEYEGRIGIRSIKTLGSSFDGYDITLLECEKLFAGIGNGEGYFFQLSSTLFAVVEENWFELKRCGKNGYDVRVFYTKREELKEAWEVATEFNKSLPNKCIWID